VSFWPRKCPVCREELPERGNRRVRVPGRRGWSLVHAGACAAAIDAQGVLDLAGKPYAVEPVLLVRARRAVQRVFDLYEPAQYATEELFALRRRLDVALDDEELPGDVGLQQLDRSPQQLRKLVDRVLAHRPEVSVPARTEAGTS
jgi:hypothetical protein